MIELPMRPQDPDLIRQLRTYLTWLQYTSLERLVVYLMRSWGYRDLSIVDCGVQRGYSRYGGMSVIARRKGPVHDSLVLVQVKQIDVARRHVDELRGAMVYHGATRGLIFTTGRIAAKAQFRADNCGVRPVRILSGQQVAEELIDSRLGVRFEPSPPGKPKKTVLDELFFELLAEVKP